MILTPGPLDLPNKCCTRCLTWFLRYPKSITYLPLQPHLPNFISICSAFYQTRKVKVSLNNFPAFPHIIPTPSPLPGMEAPLLRPLPILQGLSLETSPHFLQQFTQPIFRKKLLYAQQTLSSRRLISTEQNRPSSEKPNSIRVL